MIWYTPQFKKSFSSELELDLFIDEIFTVTNQGYNNSKIPVRAVKYDVKQHPTLTDIYDSSALIRAFQHSMSRSDLFNCADSTALLVKDTRACGVGRRDGVYSCNAYSVTRKDCASQQFTFGHELGHNFGALHNPKEYKDKNIAIIGDKYGHLIKPTSPYRKFGYRTIMAYRAYGHYTRVNHYSNPDVLFKNNPTGIEGLSNNARVITANRFLMASCGTECNACCDKVTIARTDHHWWSSHFVGTYTKYASSPMLNGHMVYKHHCKRNFLVIMFNHAVFSSEFLSVLY